MEELGATASAVISFSEKLEESSSRFYEKLAATYPAHKDLFDSFARDGRKNRTLLVRTYQETVTDALETGYSFKGLELRSFVPDEQLQEGTGLKSALESAVALEKEAARFYTDISERSKTLLSTIPAAFKKVAENRRGRIQKLEALSSTP